MGLRKVVGLDSADWRTWRGKFTRLRRTLSATKSYAKMDLKLGNPNFLFDTALYERTGYSVSSSTEHLERREIRETKENTERNKRLRKDGSTSDRPTKPTAARSTSDRSTSGRPTAARGTPTTEARKQADSVRLASAVVMGFSDLVFASASVLL